MMKIFFMSVMLCLAWLLMAPNTVCAQDQDKAIKVKLEIDGKEINQPFRLLLSVPGSAIFTPPVTDGSFIFPPELRSCEKVHLRLVYKKYELDYGDVYLTKFSDEMIFGVDTKPFDEENISTEPPPGKELILIYYLKTGGTIETTEIYN